MPIIAFFSGCLFGLGLVISGMADPAKVRAFLNVAGAWDPSLIFVLGGAVSVSAVGFFVAERRGKSLDGTPLCLPSKQGIDGRLIVGSVIFGIGWGLVGLCPGPALADLAVAGWPAGLFVAAMAAGIGLHALWRRVSGRCPLGPIASQEKKHA